MDGDEEEEGLREADSEKNSKSNGGWEHPVPDAAARVVRRKTVASA